MSVLLARRGAVAASGNVGDSATSVLLPVTQSASGTYTAPARTGDIAQTLPAVTQAATDPFSPTEIPDLKVWYEAESLGLANGAAVSSWTDRSGNGLHVTQGTAAAMPTYRTATKNGLAVVEFDGGDVLSRASTIVGNASDGTQTTFVVAKPDAVAAIALLVNNDSGSGSPRGHQIIRIENQELETLRHAIDGDGTGVGSLVAGTWYLMESHMTAGMSGQITALLNGVSNGSSTGNVIAYTVGTLSVGNFSSGSFFFDGMMAEIIVYSRNLTTAEREDVRTYLNDKYAIY